MDGGDLDGSLESNYIFIFDSIIATTISIYILIHHFSFVGE